MSKRTKITALEESKLYKTKQEMVKHANSLYQYLWKNKMLDEACGHMDNGYIKYSNGAIAQESKKYMSRTEWYRQSPSTYCAGLRKSDAFFEKCCSHMEKKPFYWSVEDIQKEANKYNYRNQFVLGSPNAYAAARRKKILAQVCSHMEYKQNSYSDDEVIKIAKCYTKKIDFSNNNKGAYAYSLRNETLHKTACSHMKTVGINFDKKGFMYYVSIDNGAYYKIGITSRSTKERFRGDTNRIRVIFIKEFKTLREAKVEEQKILKEYHAYKVDHEVLVSNGNTEIFTFDVLGLDV